MLEERITRRDILKKAAYITPVILTFLAVPSFASGGSGRDERHEEDERHEKRGRRWLWDHERDSRRERKKHWWSWE